MRHERTSELKIYCKTKTWLKSRNALSFAKKGVWSPLQIQTNIPLRTYKVEKEGLRTV